MNSINSYEVLKDFNTKEWKVYDNNTDRFKNFDTEKEANKYVCECVKKKSNEIRNKVQQMTHNIEWTQFRSMQADIGSPVFVNVDGNDYLVQPFQSYTTIVGLVDEATHTFYEVGKYSRTTSKQVTVFCNTYGYNKVYVDRIY